MKKNIALLLTAILLITGCGSSGNPGSRSQEPAAEEQTQEVQEEKQEESAPAAEESAPAAEETKEAEGTERAEAVAADTEAAEAEQIRSKMSSFVSNIGKPEKDDYGTQTLVPCMKDAYAFEIPASWIDADDGITIEDSANAFAGIFLQSSKMDDFGTQAGVAERVLEQVEAMSVGELLGLDDAESGEYQRLYFLGDQPATANTFTTVQNGITVEGLLIVGVDTKDNRLLLSFLMQTEDCEYSHFNDYIEFITTMDWQENQAAAGGSSGGKSMGNVKATDFTAVIEDDDKVRVEITGAEVDILGNYIWHMELENKTDKKLMFSMDNVSINGMMADPFWMASVDPGAVVSSDVMWYANTLTESRIDEPTDVTFDFRAIDYDDYSAEPAYEDNISVFPKGEAAAVYFEREPAEGDKVLVDNDQVTIMVIGYDEDYVIGYAPILYLKNKTDYPLLFIARDGKINGVQMSPLFADPVSPGCGSVTRVIYYDSSLEEAGIDKSSISSIELALQVIKTDTYDSIMEETFTLK